MTTTTALTERLNALSLNGHDQSHVETLSHSSPHSGSSSLHRGRGESISSLSSALYSDGRSTPNRPPKSPLRCAKGDISILTDEIDTLQAEMSGVLDKIYEIEELRHSPTLRSAHASRLDTLLSEVNDSIDALAPRMALTPTSPEFSDLTSHLRKDWAKVMAQHALLKQEMLEDPWLIRFRTTADQADGMMDPLNNSLVELTAYVGRILSSVSVSMTAQEGRLSIERLRELAGAHNRLKITYVPSVNKILNMMAKSIADRSVANGEALRRLNDMTRRWSSLQKHLVQLDAKVALVLSQNDPDHPQLDKEMEVLEDDHMFMGSPRIPQVPTLEVSNIGHVYGNPLHRVTSAGATTHGLPHHPHHNSHGPPPSSFSGLKPPSSRTDTGSITPNAQRTLRRSISRPNLPTSNSYSTLDRPRWNASTKPMSDRPASPASMTPRRPSQASSHGSSLVTPHRRPGSPTWSSPPEISRIPQRSPVKTPGSTLGTPSSRPPISTPSQRPAGTRTPSGGRVGSATPSGRPTLGARTPSGSRHSLASSISSGSRPPLSMSTTNRPSLAPALSRLPPSSWGSRSPAPANPSRASSRAMSVSSVTMSNVGLKPFVPSKYDTLDQEVQKVIDHVQPGIYIARIDAPLRRGQRKTEGEMWTGEFLFGAGSRPTAVKLLELGSRMGPASGKRVKCMVRVGGAWTDLVSYLTKKREEAREEVLDDEF